LLSGGSDVEVYAEGIDDEMFAEIAVIGDNEEEIPNLADYEPLVVNQTVNKAVNSNHLEGR
jgi:hypothetical protein